jgi:hypothetical protein
MIAAVLVTVLGPLALIAAGFAAVRWCNRTDPEDK